MTNLSVCIDAVFNGRPVDQALKAVSAAGFDAFEFWSWWDKDLDQIAALADELSLTPTICTTRFISLVDPSFREQYLEGLEATIAAAQTLGIKRLISQTGNDLGTAKEGQTESVIAGLRACVPHLEAAGIELLLEPLNTKVDHPGYFLTSSSDAFEIVKAVNSPYVKVLFDIYHQQITEGDVIRSITENIDLIGHFHTAGNPGRHELHIGELNYSEIFKAIDQADFSGYVGLEYFPLDKDQPLKFLSK